MLSAHSYSLHALLVFAFLSLGDLPSPSTTEPPSFFENQSMLQANIVCGFLGELTIEGNSISITGLEVLNSGTEAAGSSHIGYYLSTDDIITRDDIRIGEDFVDPLEPNQVSIESFEASITDVPDGVYFVGIVVDDLGEVPESSGEDNFCFYGTPRLIIGNSAKPDLACFNFGELIVNGPNISVEGTDICNIGLAAAGSSKVGYYLSLDTDITTGDIFIGEEDIDPMGVADPEICQTLFFTTPLPDDIPAGEYFVGMVLDYTNQVDESNEADNSCFFDTPKVQIEDSEPDEKANLVCGELGTLTIDGRSVSIVGFEVRNIGEAQAPASTVGFYLSIDQDVTRDDIRIGQASVEILEAGQSSLKNLSSTLSTDIPNGEYFVGMVVDELGTVEETSGDDNFCNFAFPKVILPPEGEEQEPNLVCGDLGSLTIDGTTLSISDFQVLNAGNADAGSSTVGFYLSTDTDIQRDDIPFRSESVGPLTPGQTQSFSFSQTVSNIPNGTYFVGMFTDDGSTVRESDGNDNTCFYANQTLTINQDTLPNLVCGQLGELSYVDDILSVSGFQVQNIGNREAGASVVGFYLSTDAEVSRADIPVNALQVKALTPGELVELSFQIPLSGIPNGTYYLGMVVDDTGVVLESSGDDNFCVFDSPLIEIDNPEPEGPNLVCGELGTLGTDINELSIENLEIKNIGDATAGNSHIGYYLSEDTSISRDDIFIGEDLVESLAPGGRSFHSFSPTLRNVPNGTYYVGIVVDYKGEVLESNGEDNFCSYFPTTVTIEVLEPNLVCGDLGTLTVDEDRLTLEDFEVKNIGESRAGISHVGYYLSEDPQISRDDIFLGEDEVRALNPNESTRESFFYNLSQLEVGTYYFGIVVDYLGEVKEVSGNDNFCRFDSPLIRIEPESPADLSCGEPGRITVSNNTLSIQDQQILNIGEGPASESQVGFYLSFDENLDDADIFLGAEKASPLQGGRSTRVTFRSELPVSGASYFVIISIDELEEVPEQNGDNNTCILAEKVEVPLPNLACLDVGEVEVDYAENLISFSNQVIGNIGEGFAPENKSGFFLSKDQNFSFEEDILIRAVPLDALESQEEVFLASIEIELPKIDTGSYYVGFILDYQNTVPETEGNDNVCFFSSERIVFNNICESPIILDLSIENATCGSNSGSASVVATGGAGGFDFLWSGGETESTINNLPSGPISVTVSDEEGCLAQANAIIEDRPANAPEPTFTFVKEEENRVKFLISTPQITSTYRWDFGDETERIVDGDSSTAEIFHTFPSAGVYSVCLFASNECGINLSCEEVFVSPQASCNLSVSQSVTQPSCGLSNGSINLEVNGAENPLNYSWDISPNPNSPSISEIPQGVYEVLISDGNCESTLTFNLVDQNAPSIEILETSASDCEEANGSATLNVFGGSSPYVFEWSNGNTLLNATDLPVGRNFLKVTDSKGCEVETPIFIESLQGSTPTVADFSVELEGNRVSFTNESTEAERLQWNFGDGFSTEELQPTHTYDTSETVFFRVTLITENACNSDTLVKIINLRYEDPCGLAYEVSSTRANCQNPVGSATILVQNNPENTSYSWLVEPKSFGASRDQLPVGVYKVKVNQDNCVDTLSVRIKGDDSYPKARFEVFPEANGLLLKNTSLYADSFFWDLGYGESSSEQSLTINLANIPSDFQRIRITLTATKEDCGSDTISQVIELAEFRNPNNVAIPLEESLILYPNPNSGSFYLEGLSPGKPISVKVFTSLGQLVHRVENLIPSEESLHITLPGQSPGRYWLRIQGQNQELHTLAIQIQ